MGRIFIDETIDTLEKSAVEIKKVWSLFKNGEINKKKFEEEYRHVLSNWLRELVDEEYYDPNNGCKYKDTNPECEYFNKKNI